MANFLESNSKKAFLAVFLLALILRLWGIWHGYPYSFYPDEAHFVKRALSFGSGDFNPHWFHKPAFYMYLLFFDYGIYFLVGKIIGLWPSVSQFAVSYIKNPGPFYLIGRFTTVLFSLGSVWVVFKIGERHFKKGVGVFAALLLALSYGHVISSQNVKADTPAMFFIILSMFFLLNYIKGRKIRDIVLAAAIAGVGTATKAYPILMLSPMVIAVVLIQSERGTDGLALRLGKMVCLSGLGILMLYAFYFICAPYNFIDPLGRGSIAGPFLKLARTVLSIFGVEKVISAGPGYFIGHRMGVFGGALDYLNKLINTGGMGIVVFGVGILGVLCLIIRRPNKRNLVFLSFPILFALVSIITNPGYAEPRHQVPIYPFLAITGGAFVVWLAGKSQSKQGLVYGLLLISLSWPLFNIIKRDIFVSRADTRNIAKAWIEHNIPAGTKVLIDENGPQLSMTDFQLARKLEESKKADQKGQFTTHYNTYLKYQLMAARQSLTYELYEIRFPWWRESEVKSGVHELASDYDKDMGNPLRLVGVRDYEYYAKNGYEYAVVNSYNYKRFLGANTVSKRFPSFTQFYRGLFARARLVKEFPLPAQNRPGPRVKIFRFEP